MLLSLNLSFIWKSACHTSRLSYVIMIYRLTKIKWQTDIQNQKKILGPLIVLVSKQFGQFHDINYVIALEIE